MVPTITTLITPSPSHNRVTTNAQLFLVAYCYVLNENVFIVTLHNMSSYKQFSTCKNIENEKALENYDICWFLETQSLPFILVNWYTQEIQSNYMLGCNIYKNGGVQWYHLCMRSALYEKDW